MHVSVQILEMLLSPLELPLSSSSSELLLLLLLLLLLPNILKKPNRLLGACFFGDADLA
jgi:hypothetical protein